MAGLRIKIDRWRFSMVVAYFGIAFTIVGLYIIYTKQSREETRRVAETRAAAVQQVAGCFASVKNAPVVRGFVAGQEALIVNGIDGNKAALKIKAQDPKLRAVREASLRRLNVAKANNDVLRALIKATTPTRKGCIQLAVKTRVPYQQYVPRAPNTTRKQTSR